MSSVETETDPEAAPSGPNGPSLRQDVRDAVSPRTFLLVLGVLALQIGFVLSYVGALHAPSPHRIPIAVVAPTPQAAAQVAGQLNALPKDPLEARVALDEAFARRLIADGDVSAALIVAPDGADTLLVASGAGAAVATAVEGIIRQVEGSTGRQVQVQDIVPLQPGDARGLTGFYLVIGWIVGGYLVAALLGIAKGARPATVQRAAIRLTALLLYAIVSGLAGVIVVGPVLGALTGHFLALWGLGTLLVLAAATVTMAFEVLFGIIGIGITVLVFVVLGNPSAGGAYQPALLPTFWREIGLLLPNGAGTDAVRRIVYLGGNGVWSDVLVIALYAILGAAVSLIAPMLRNRRDARVGAGDDDAQVSSPAAT